MEMQVNDCVFHFNKKHLSDPKIPMWILKIKGISYYVDHVICEKGWSTKETPDNPHTKGAIKIKKCLVSIEDGVAHIRDGPPDETESKEPESSNQGELS